MINPLALTPYQQYFYLAWQMDPDSHVYNESISFKLAKKPDINKLTKAIEIFIDKHEVTQMRYDQITQQLTHGPFVINDYFHILSATVNAANKQIKKLTVNFFDLHSGPCIKFYLFRADESWYFLVCSHHIICDAISARVMIDDIANAYNAQHKTKVKPLPYHTYRQAVSATHSKYTSNYDKAKQYWQNYLHNQPLFTPLKQHCLCEKNTRTEAVDFLIKKNNIRMLTKKYRTTIFILLASCYGFLLTRYIQRSKLTLSYPINVRDKNHSHAIGCFINNIPLKIDLSTVTTFSDLVKMLNSDRKQSKTYRQFPSIEIFNNLKTQKKMETKNNYINIGIAQTNLNTTTFDLFDIQTTCIDFVSSTRAHYDLLLLFDEYQQDSIKFRFKFNNAYLDKGFIEKLISQLNYLIKNIIQEDIILNTYNILPPKQYQKILHSFNQTYAPDHTEKMVVSLLTEQICKTPEQSAFLTTSTHLCYKDLSQRIAQVQQKFIPYAQQPIGVYLPNSLDFHIIFWAILYANGIYLPLDLRHPIQKLDYLLQKANCKIIITNKALAPSFAHINNIKLVIIEDCLINNKQHVITKPPTISDMAYILFTSGTTGQPKGVMVAHSALSNRIQWMQKAFHITHKDVVLQKTTHCFDVSLWEMIWPVCYGAKLAIAEQNIAADFHQLYKFMELKKVSIVHFVPSMLQAFLTFLQSWQQKLPKNLRLMICSGEALPCLLVTQAYQLARHPRFALYNLYGPTEACIDVTYHYCRSQQPVYIGKPIDNTEIYILDNQQRSQPIGIVGELYIGGKALAQGYINDQDLTDKYFVKHPFKRNKRLYKSGDLALRLNDGTLVYVGRVDNEVKINGQRVCLDEIEAAILSAATLCRNMSHYADKEAYKAKTKSSSYDRRKCISQYMYIQSCTVLYRAPHIIACYTTQNAKVLNDIDVIQTTLKKILLPFMLPTQWQHFTTLPTTESGKVDKLTLLQQIKIRHKKQHTHLASTPIEIQLSNLWQKVLQLDQVDIDANFTELGIDSLQAVTLLSYINKTYTLTLHAADLYHLQTIKVLAKHIQQNKPNHCLVKYLAGQANRAVLYFIHPAKAGCEVYQTLATQLTDTYQCFGIDNYNLYCKDHQRIHILSRLASHYVLQIKQNHTLSKENIYLCGWSLGGMIALEIAYQLEQDGFKNIHVILLDTYLTDLAIKKMRNPADKNLFMLNYFNELKTQKVKKHWSDKLMQIYPVESLLEEQQISGPLYYTRVTLFKAQQLMPIDKTNILYRRLNKYIINLPLNNIDLYIHKSRICCINLSCHHDNIVDTLSMLAGFHLLQAILKGRKSSCKPA